MTARPITVSAAFATDIDTPEHVAIAESLGYQRAWLYDTPQQSPDVWMALALCAERTTTIGLAPGVLVPSLRHPMVNAAGALTLDRLAPGRVAVGFGTGYTGRRAIGRTTSIPWAHMSEYIAAFAGLIRGEVVQWDGAPMKVLDAPESAPNIPIYIAATGPKGLAVAAAQGEGVFVGGRVPDGVAGIDQVVCLSWGTVFDEGETLDSPRVRDAAGPGVAQTLHWAHEMLGRPERVASLPGGREWLDVIERTPEDERHLAVHDGHCVRLNEADAAAWDAGAKDLAPRVTLTGTAEHVRRRLDDLVAQGVSEIAYQPAGDIPRELEAFVAAAGGA